MSNQRKKEVKKEVPYQPGKKHKVEESELIGMDTGFDDDIESADELPLPTKKEKLNSKPKKETVDTENVFLLFAPPNRKVPTSIELMLDEPLRRSPIQEPPIPSVIASPIAHDSSETSAEVEFIDDDNYGYESDGDDGMLNHTERLERLLENSEDFSEAANEAFHSGKFIQELAEIATDSIIPLDLPEDVLQEELEEAIDKQNKDTISNLLALNADVSAGVMRAINNEDSNMLELFIEYGAEKDDEEYITAAIDKDSSFILSVLQAEASEENVQYAAEKHSFGALEYFFDQDFDKAHEWALFIASKQHSSRILDAICAYATKKKKIIRLDTAIRAKSAEMVERLLKAGVEQDDHDVEMAITIDSEQVLKALKVSVNEDNVKLAASNSRLNSLKYFFITDFASAYLWALEIVVERSNAKVLELMCDYLQDDATLKVIIIELHKEERIKLISILFAIFGVGRVLKVIQTRKKLHADLSELATKPLKDLETTDAELEDLLATFEDRLAVSAILLPFPGGTITGTVNRDIEETRNFISRDPKLANYVKKAASLIGVSLSVASRHFLRIIKSPYYQFHRASSETYPRSSQGILVKHFRDRAKYQHKASRPEAKIKAKEMKGGMRASAGLFLPSLEVIMDDHPKQGKSKRELKTSIGNSHWYNRNLYHRRLICRKIKKISGQTTCLTVGYYNKYPCVMVHVNQSPEMGKLSEAAAEAWTETVISFYLGIVNYIAQNQGFAIELVRRAGFGALTPTIAPCARSFRINVGLIPTDFAIILAKCLTILDQSLQQLYINRSAEADVIPHECFLYKREYKTYLEREVPEANGLFNLLWQKVERTNSGRKTIQSIVRTSFARDGLTAEFHRLTLEQYPRSAKECAAIFLACLNWGVKRLRAVGATLNFDSSGQITFRPLLREHVKIEDTHFLNILRDLANHIRTQRRSTTQLPDFIVKKQDICLAAIDTCAKNQTLDRLYFHLELLNEMLYSQSIYETARKSRADHGSDSELEEEYETGREIYANKIIVYNGMRAIWSSLHAAAEYLTRERPKKKANVYLRGSYYEIAEVIQVLEKYSQFVKSADINGSRILFTDINSCITDASPLHKLTKALKNFQIIVLDSTSATSAACQKWIDVLKQQENIQALFFVSSGLKNEQMGADKNQYGTVRIFTKDKALLISLVQSIRTAEPPVQATVSHSYRRLMKRLGFVPTNHAILTGGKIDEMQPSVGAAAKVPATAAIPAAAGILASSVSFSSTSLPSSVPSLPASFASSPASRVTTPSSTIQRGGMDVSRIYWYEDSEMRRILEFSVAQHHGLSADGRSVHILGPLDNISPYGLLEALNDHNRHEGIMLIPFNLGRLHWVGLIFEYNAAGRLVLAKYYDPQSGDPPQFLTQILRVFHKTQKPLPAFIIARGRALISQTNSSDCGPCTIENLLAGIGYPEPGTTDSIGRRLRHLQILRDAGDDVFYQQFYNRQRQNLSSFATLRKQSLGSAKKFKFTADNMLGVTEYYAILSLTLQILELPDKLSKELQLALQPVKESVTGEEHTAQLAQIRAVLNEYFNHTSIKPLISRFFYLSEDSVSLEKAPLRLDYNYLQLLSVLFSLPKKEIISELAILEKQKSGKLLKAEGEKPELKIGKASGKTEHFPVIPSMPTKFKPSAGRGQKRERDAEEELTADQFSPK